MNKKETDPHLQTLDHLLWFDYPAAYYTEACPLGNGRLGAMPFGGPVDERVVLNESGVGLDLALRRIGPMPTNIWPRYAVF